MTVEVVSDAFLYMRRRPVGATINAGWLSSGVNHQYTPAGGFDGEPHIFRLSRPVAEPGAAPGGPVLHGRRELDLDGALITGDAAFAQSGFAPSKSGHASHGDNLAYAVGINSAVEKLKLKDFLIKK